ncbi:MAG: ribosome small subunit-dependent GTPase A [Bacillota bacterium]
MKEKGIVVKTVGGFFFVADQNSEILQLNIRGRIQKDVYPGDYVYFSRKNSTIEELCPRDNLLPRPRVANVEQILIVHSFLRPALDKHLLDRFLVMVEAASLEPVIVLNKKDLVDEQKLEKMNLTLYEEIGYPVFMISVRNDENLDSVYDYIKEKVNVLTGPSGAGKSSLINSLVPEAEMEIKSISKSLEQGVHTTRHVELLPVEDQGWIADTPGFRSLDFTDILPQELAFLYPEFEKYINQCKFNMCSHTHEPGCAVKKAVKNGEIASSRYQGYCDFYQELKQKEEQKYD